VAVYLITGIGGFIGSSLAHALMLQGHEVRGIDNFSTGKRENLHGLTSRIKVHEFDLSDRVECITPVCEGVDYILHQAALPSVPRSIEDPESSNRANVTGTLNLLIAAKQAAERDGRKKRIVYAASSSAYGDTPTLPKREDMLPTPISPYAVAKLTGELYMQSFFRCYGIETISLRYFNVFGPRQDPSSQYSGVISKFIMAMLREEQPVIYGDGTQTRDFTYIDNVVSANLLACSVPGGPIAGKVFNIACGQRIDLNQTFAAIKKLTGYSGNVKYDPPRSGDIKHSLADVSLAQKHLGFRPLVGFEEGLSRTIAWYRESTLSTKNGISRTS
jgi:UDP-glucose 4-epimerase